MRITYDPRADALAIELRDAPVARTREVTDTINVDLGKDGRPVVVEILNVRKGLGDEVLRHVGLDLGGIQWQQESDTVHATDEAAQLVGVSRPDLRAGIFPSRAILERYRSEEHTSELQSRVDLVCRLLLEKKKKINK